MYFDQLSGAVGTQKEVKTLIFGCFQTFLVEEHKPNREAVAAPFMSVHAQIRQGFARPFFILGLMLFFLYPPFFFKHRKGSPY